MLDRLLQFKDNSVRAEFESGKLHPRLLIVLLALAGYAIVRWGIVITVTDIFRKRTTDSGVHEAWRGVDVRSRDWPKEAADDILRWLNESFCYDQARPTLKVAMIHDADQGPGLSGIHLHLQVSGNPRKGWE